MIVTWFVRLSESFKSYQIVAYLHDIRDQQKRGVEKCV
jgi:hypothetical protein